MAISYPITNIIDELDGVGWSTSFELLYRQEQSRHASGRTRVKDFGTPIWQASYTTKTFSPNKIDYWKARLNTLENGIQIFRAYPRSRCWPIAHPNGIVLDDDGDIIENPFANAQLLSRNVNNKAIRLKGIPFVNISVGDYVSIRNLLYQAVEPASAGADGNSTEFEVRPHLAISISVDDEVSLVKPHCNMTLTPGSVSATTGLNGRGSISFSAIEARG